MTGTKSNPIADASGGIESVMQELRVFQPVQAVASAAHIRSMEAYLELYQRSIDDPEGFWGEAARELHWFEPWKQVLHWKSPDAKWFVGGKTNLSYNCLDRQVEAGLGDQVALIWEGEPTGESGLGEVRQLTYSQLLDETCRLANALRSLGVGKGDIVTIYMPMVPEAAVAMLACARIASAVLLRLGSRWQGWRLRDACND